MDNPNRPAAVPPGRPPGRSNGEPSGDDAREIGRLVTEFSSRLLDIRMAWLGRLVIIWRNPSPAPADLAHLRAALAGLNSVAEYLIDPPATIGDDLIPGFSLDLDLDPGDDAPGP
jgi:hypothetical protein